LILEEINFGRNVIYIFKLNIRGNKSSFRMLKITIFREKNMDWGHNFNKFENKGSKKFNLNLGAIFMILIK
jgi:hypothetical protein